MRNILSLILAAFLFLASTAASAGEHAHFAAFFDPSGKAALPDEVKGDDIESTLKKLGAEMMIFAHSAGVKDGDVWSLQNNTLREFDGKFVDLGADCQLTLKLKPYVVQGLCSVFMNGHDGAGQEKAKSVINAKDIETLLVWHKVFEDKEHGIVGYFMRETAADFNH